MNKLNIWQQSNFKSISMWYFSVKREHVSFYRIKIHETTATMSTILNIIQTRILGVEYHHKICASHFDNKHLYYNFICNTNLSMLTSSTNILLLQQFCILYSNLLSTLLSTHYHEEKGKRTATTSLHLILPTVTLLNLVRSIC